MDESEDLIKSTRGAVIASSLAMAFLTLALAGLSVVFYFMVPAGFVPVLIISIVVFVVFFYFFLVGAIFQVSLKNAYCGHEYEKGAKLAQKFQKMLFGRAKASCFIIEMSFDLLMDEIKEAEEALSHVKDAKLLSSAFFERTLLLLNNGDYNAAYSLYLTFYASAHSVVSMTVNQEVYCLSGLFHHIEGVPLDKMEVSAISAAIMPLVKRLYEATYDGVKFTAPLPSVAAEVEKTPSIKPTHSVLMLVLFIVTLAVIPLAFMIAAVAGAIARRGDPTIYALSYYWICFLFALIPLCSLVLGAVMKHGNPRAKTLKNIIAGALVIPPLLLMGSMTFLDNGKYDYAIGKYIESNVSISLPKQGKARYVQGSSYSDAAFEIALDGILVFTDKTEADSFDQTVASSPSWIEGGLKELSPYIPTLLYETITTGTKTMPVLLYNITEKTFNSVPSLKSGKYHFMALASNPTNDWLSFAEYLYSF